VRHQGSNPNKTTTVTKATLQKQTYKSIFSICFSVWKLSKAHRCAVLLHSPQLFMQKEQQMMSHNRMKYSRCGKLVMRFDSRGRCDTGGVSDSPSPCDTSATKIIYSEV